MVQMIVPVCDLCQQTATRVNVPVAIGDAPPGTIDLCEAHHRTLLQPVLDALAAHGLDPVTAQPRRNHRQGWKRRVGPFLCRAGCTAAPLKSAATLEQHLIRLHGMSLDEYVATYGELVPLTPEEQAEIDVEVACEVKGCGAVYSLSRGNRYPQQAMVSHMWGRHAIKWSPAPESQGGPMSGVVVGARVRLWMGTPKRGGWQHGTVTGIDTGSRPGVEIRLDEPVSGLPTCYATHEEVEALP